MKLAERVFSLADQAWFASASGDCNPMHVDPVQARRTQAGAPVVHGIHLLLWSLDSLASAHADLPPLRRLRAQFQSFVFVNEPVEVELAQKSETGVRLVIVVVGSLRSKVRIDFGQQADSSPEWAAQTLTPVAPTPEPLNLTLEEMSNRSGRFPVRMSPQQAVDMFPRATRWLGARQVAALAATTELVGMICPGLHSIYSELEVSSCDSPSLEKSLAYRVTDTDARFRSVDLEIVTSSFSGTAKTFARHPLVQQPLMSSLAKLVAPAEFAGAAALIVGGSRGLGELTAKLIAAGGGRVFITWQTGKLDAERVASEIRDSGRVCDVLSYDVRLSAAAQLAGLEIHPTHAYYFATPTIYRPQAEMFSSDRLRELLAVYTDGFWNLSQALRYRQPRISLFYPSSVFVTEHPKGMTEYAMAKAAGELLCEDMNASLAPTHVTVRRLPRLPTDQTATVTPADVADPIETMLPIVRHVQSWPQ